MGNVRNYSGLCRYIQMNNQNEDGTIEYPRCAYCGGYFNEWAKHTNCRENYLRFLLQCKKENQPRKEADSPKENKTTITK